MKFNGELANKLILIIKKQIDELDKSEDDFYLKLRFMEGKIEGITSVILTHKLISEIEK